MKYHQSKSINIDHKCIRNWKQKCFHKESKTSIEVQTGPTGKSCKSQPHDVQAAPISGVLQLVR